MSNPIRDRLVSLVIALFLMLVSVDAQAARSALLPEDTYGATIRSGASPDGAHPSGTLFMVSPSNGGLTIVEWDIAHAVVVRRVPLGMRASDSPPHAARGRDRFYVAAKADKGNNVLLAFDGALRPVFSRDLPPGDIDDVDAADDVLAVTTNLRDFQIRLTSIDPKTFADRASVVLAPNFIVDHEFAPCGPRGALKIKDHSIYVHTRCLASQTRVFGLRGDGHVAAVDAAMMAPEVWSDTTIHAHGLAIAVTKTRQLRARLTWH